MIKRDVKNIAIFFFFFSLSPLSVPDGESSHVNSKPDRSGNILQGLIKH